MKFISVRDLRARSSEVWRDLAGEGEMVITLNGRPVAILSAVSEETLEDSIRAVRRARALMAVDRLQRQSAAAGRDRMDLDAINDEISEARRQRQP